MGCGLFCMGRGGSFSFVQGVFFSHLYSWALGGSCIWFLFRALDLMGGWGLIWRFMDGGILVLVGWRGGWMGCI